MRDTSAENFAIADPTFDGRNQGRILELAQRKTPAPPDCLDPRQRAQTVFDIRECTLAADETTFPPRRDKTKRNGVFGAESQVRAFETQETAKKESCAYKQDNG